MVTETEFRLVGELRRLQSTGRAFTVGELAGQLGVSSALVSRQLGRLHAAGWVERRAQKDPRGRVVHYFPRAASEFRWVSPVEGIAWSWEVHGEIDWEFPLASQVPDPASRETVLALLRHLRDKRLLSRAAFEIEERGRSKRLQRNGLTVVVYGSSARGMTRPGSDVDVLTVQDEKEPSVAAIVHDAAAEVSLGSPRPIQLRHLDVEEVAGLPDHMATSLKRDAVVVWDSLHRGIWRFLYGERR